MDIREQHNKVTGKKSDRRDITHDFRKMRVTVVTVRHIDFGDCLND